jgi:hypothetical protein
VRLSLFSSHLTADPIEVDDCVEARGNSVNSKPPVFLLKYGENCLLEFPKTRETLPLSSYLTADPIRVNDCVLRRHQRELRHWQVPRLYLISVVETTILSFHNLMRLSLSAHT